MLNDNTITISMEEAQHIAFYAGHLKKENVPDDVVHVLEKIKNEYESYMKKARLLMEQSKHDNR